MSEENERDRGKKIYLLRCYSLWNNEIKTNNSSNAVNKKKERRGERKNTLTAIQKELCITNIRQSVSGRVRREKKNQKNIYYGGNDCDSNGLNTVYVGTLFFFKFSEHRQPKENDRFFSTSQESYVRCIPSINRY